MGLVQITLLRMLHKRLQAESVRGSRSGSRSSSRTGSRTGSRSGGGKQGGIRPHVPQLVEAGVQQQQAEGALGCAEDPLGTSPWLMRFPAGGPGSVAAPNEVGGADEPGRPVTPCMDEPEAREGRCMPLTPPVAYSMDTGWPPSDARFQLPASGYSHWTGVQMGWCT